MKADIKGAIAHEDNRNPLTDEELAKQLHMFREQVTRLRKELGIPASSERRRSRLLQTIQGIFRENGILSDRKLAEKLKEKGYEIGKYALGRLRKANGSIWAGSSGTKSAFKAPTEAAGRNDDSFARFIGHDKSMKNQISKAKAAVMYPPKGLHTLLYGPSGVGKSFLAELMYEYAVQTDNFSEGSPYYAFNCADYADNPQLLLAQLFGYAKGAFTGAAEHHKGIVELCDGGVLFLDEIHRLPPEGQEILFYLIDKGRFRRLGEADADRQSQPLIIAATTEDPESSLLLTFRRRIPMSIEIPSLEERPPEEKWQFIQLYFSLERSRLACDIKVSNDVLSCLLLAAFPGNIGQLKSDIQVCCAKAFLESRLKNQQELEVTAENLPEHLKAYQNRPIPRSMKHMLQGDVLFLETGTSHFYRQSNHAESSGIYEQLEHRYTALSDSGIDREQISRILQEEVEETLLNQVRSITESRFSFHELSNIVGQKALDITQAAYHEAKKALPSLLDAIIFPLAIHIRSVLDMNVERKQAFAESFDDIKRRYAREFAAAISVLSQLNKTFYIHFPKEEAVFFAMYFSRFQGKQIIQRGRPAVIVLSHGRVAGGMVEIANKILGTNYAAALEMPLSGNPAAMYERTKEAVLELDQGQGCILLADMGSLLTFGEQIGKETGIPVASVGRVDTLMVIECLHKVLWTEESPENIAAALNWKAPGSQGCAAKPQKAKENAVLCLCITGIGAARVLQKFLSERLKSVLGNIAIVTRGYIEHTDAVQMIDEAARQYDLLAVVGTVDPESSAYPFISAAEIYQAGGISKLRSIIKKHSLPEHIILGEAMPEELIVVNPGYRMKDQVLDQAVEAMIAQGYVEERFLLSLYKREGLMTTYLKGGIAIPHGDPAHVTKPVIAVTKLDKPILWDGTNTVDLVFILALKEDSKKYFEQLYQIIGNESLVNSIRKSNSIPEIKKNLHLDTKPSD